MDPLRSLTDLLRYGSVLTIMVCAFYAGWNAREQAPAIDQFLQTPSLQRLWRQLSQ